MVLYNMFVAGVRVVESGAKHLYIPRSFDVLQEPSRALQRSKNFEVVERSAVQWLFVVVDVVWGRHSARDATSGLLHFTRVANSRQQYRHYAVDPR